MNKTFHLKKILGIDVSVHWTFLLFLAWILIAGVFGGGLTAALIQTGFVVAAFGCVLLHELGHAMAARIFGIPTHGITLLPIGGVAQLDRIPRNPWQEFIIAIAGPAVNLLIAGMIVTFFFLTSTTVPHQWIGFFPNQFLTNLLTINMGLVLFNFIPAFPMDGGRVLRAFIASFSNYVVATKIATRCGQAVAVLFGIAGLYYNPMLILIAVFIAIAAEAEFQHVLSTEHQTGPISLPTLGERLPQVRITILNPRRPLSDSRF